MYSRRKRNIVMVKLPRLEVGVGWLGPDGGRRIGLGPGSGRAGRALRGRLVPVLIRATDERDIFHLPQIEGTTQKIDFFSVVLFDMNPPLQDRKFYADFKNVIYF